MREINKVISISDLTKIFGVTTRTLRYYEDFGLIESAERVNGIRYYHQEKIIKRIDEISFLKSLGYKLRDIKHILNNPLYIKPILMNIRLNLIYKKIDELKSEISDLKKALETYGWKEIMIENAFVLEEMEKEYTDLFLVKERISKKEEITIEDAIAFVKYYKKWHARVGIHLSEEHLRAITFNSKIQMKDEKVRELFIKYFE